MMNETFCLALIQQSYTGSRETMIESTRKAIASIAASTDLVLLQELHTTEYFCQSENEAFFDYALCFEDNVCRFSAIAKENAVVLVGSFFERRAAGLYHNTAVVFEKDGSVAGMYRKMHIPDDPGFYEKYYFAPGDLGFEPIATSVGKLGVLVCWDQWYPEAARLMALAGADLLIYPTAIGWESTDTDDEKARQLEAWITVQRGHAVANGLPVITVNRTGYEPDPSGATNGISFWGNSFVTGPQGELLFRAPANDECIEIIDIDLARSEQVRRWWPFMRDRRIDAYGDITKRFLR